MKVTLRALAEIRTRREQQAAAALAHPREAARQAAEDVRSILNNQNEHSAEFKKKHTDSHALFMSGIVKGAEVRDILENSQSMQIRALRIRQTLKLARILSGRSLEKSEAARADFVKAKKARVLLDKLYENACIHLAQIDDFGEEVLSDDIAVFRYRGNK